MQTKKNTNTQILPRRPSSFVDLLIDDLLDQDWDKNERPCYDQIHNILINVRNSTLWAHWIWDSNQLPTGQFYGSHNHLGNFDQCLRKVWLNDDPVSTQYCLVDITLADTELGRKLADVNPYDTSESYFHVITKYGLKFNILSWGVCIPKVCQAQSVERFVRTLFRLSHFGTINPHPSVKIQGCQVSRMPPTNVTGFNLLKWSAILLVAISCTCTYYTKKGSESKSNSIAMKMVSAFDLNSNVSDLMSIGKEEIKVMHGIRFLTACIVVNIHTVLITIMSTAGNGLDGNDDFKRYGRFLANLSIIVDTYFMMSGLLLMNSFKPETGRPINPLKLMLKRYFRLLWVYIIAILIVLIVSPYLNGGPLWPKIANDEYKACKKTWWLGLLMLGNYVDTQNLCMVVTWYVPADYHLAVVSTIMYWLYQKNRRGGLYLFCLIFMVSFLLPGLETYFNQLNAVTVFDFETVANYRENVLSSPIYIASHFRATPYFVGLMAGYIISVYKPVKYRRVISKKYSIIIFIIIFALSVSMLIIGAMDRFREYNGVESAFFATFNRSIWAILMAATILLCEYGNLTLITDFLSWSAFVPLSKLSYGIYMCHFSFGMRLIVNLRSPGWHDMLKLQQDAFGILVISSLLSLYLALFIEYPLNNLVALLLRTKNPKLKQDGGKNNTTSVKSVSGNEYNIDNKALVEKKIMEKKNKLQ